ncbi:MAG: AAA family ATPase [Lachnospiraceae bacterium]
MESNELYDGSIDKINALTAIRKEINRVIIGKEDVVDKVLMAMLAGGHILLEDIPGVGKTTMALAFANVLGMNFKRVQFTPDVLPSDITGYEMYNSATGQMEYKTGAVACNLLLADEINRTSPKTQSALLEVMEEGKVTVDGVTRKVPSPFVVMATQNPSGSAGTHSLPDSQLDRFIVCLSLGYPEIENEIAIMKGHGVGNQNVKADSLISASDFELMQQYTGSVYVSDVMYDYIARLSKATRECADITLGLSPRASIAMCKMARAGAVLKGRDFVLPDDVMEIFMDVAKHRIILSQTAKMERKSKKEILDNILKSVKIPKIKR